MAMNYKVKGLQEFLAEDGSLTEQMTYEEFKGKGTAPDNSDVCIEDAYETYATTKEKMKHEVL